MPRFDAVQALNNITQFLYVLTWHLVLQIQKVR